MTNYIIDFKDELTRETIDQYFSDNNINVVKEFGSFGHVFLVEADIKPTLSELIESVIEDDNNDIKLLGIDIILPDSNITTSFDIEDNKNWWKTASITPIDFDQPQHTHTVRGYGSTIYLMDSGIESSHPEFSDASIISLHSFTGDFIDTKGHGTALASLISGKTCGLTGATIKVVKIFDANTPTKQSDMLAAFDAIASDYISCGKPLSIVNMSWGFSKNDYINAKIEHLANIGLFLVAAAGNSGVPIDDITPASIPVVFTIGAYDDTLKPCNFSNYTGSVVSLTTNETNHGELDGWAPGSNIWAASLNGSYGLTAGTSQAAAIASGALAYNLSSNTDSNGLAPERFINYNAMLNGMKNEWKPKSDNSSVYVNSQINYDNLTPFMFATGRPDLLNLTDPKYANSFNTIVTYKTGPIRQNSVINILVTENTTKHRPVADKASTARISTTQDIPNNITIDENGILTVVAPAATQPTSKIAEFTLELNQRDGSTTTSLVGVYVLREDITKETAPNILPSDDPVLNMVLYYDCASGYCGSCPTGYGCGGNFTPKGAFVCYWCYTITSDIRLKENIDKIDEIDNIGIYSYNYVWDKTRTHTGAMAQELLQSKYKDSVSENSGFYTVNINKLPESIRKFYLK